MLFRTAQKIELRQKKECIMWRKPKVIEIAVGMEINSYACAVTA
jgi:coenzyme PQQ precursor peptide PqqA